MVFKTTGNKSEPVVLFFHAMGWLGKAACRLLTNWRENSIVLCQPQQCIAPDRGTVAKEMRYSKWYDFWRNKKSKR